MPQMLREEDKVNRETTKKASVMSGRESEQRASIAKEEKNKEERERNKVHQDKLVTE
jgi:hypothetical protein